MHARSSFYETSLTAKMPSQQILKSPWGNIDNFYRGNVADFVLNSPPLLANPDKSVLVDAVNGDRISATQLRQYVAQAAYVLRHKYDIHEDDVVALFAPNTIYTPVTYYAIASLGAVITPVNVVYTPEELHHQLKVSNAKLIIRGDLQAATADNALKVGSHNVSKVISLADFAKQAISANGSVAPLVLKGDAALSKPIHYCFSSGTSGVPKGVITTHYNMTSNAQQQFGCGSESINSNVVFGAVLPMSHIFGLSKYVYTAIYAAGTVVVFPKFDLELFLKKIIEYKIDVLHLVPPILVVLAKSPLLEQFQMNGIVEKITTGAAPAGKELISQVEKRTGASIAQGYGLTETSPVTHSGTYSPDLYNQDSIGWLVPSCEARIVNPEGNDVEQGQPGELWIRGPNVMKGYLNNPKATGETLTSDGFLRTGDVAIIDKTGQYYIVDRLKELIKSKGHQVAPAELEALLLGHPDVVDVAVTGIINKADATELPRAYVVLRSKDVNPLDIKTWFDGKVSRHKRLWGGITVLDAIPKSPSGKILRRLLRERKNDFAYGYSEERSAKL